MTQADNPAVAIDRLRGVVARVLPVVSTETPDYAELTFGDARARAMTMEPDTFLALNALPDLITAYESQARELDEAKQNVCAFCAPWAVTYARDRGYPEGHLHPAHYDILERAGARMDDFTRAALTQSPPATENGE